MRFKKEYRYKTPDGKKSSRFADIVAINDENKVVEVYQIGRVNKTGNLVKREREAIVDIYNSPDFDAAFLGFVKIE